MCVKMNVCVCVCVKLDGIARLFQSFIVLFEFACGSYFVCEYVGRKWVDKLNVSLDASWSLVEKTETNHNSTGVFISQNTPQSVHTR
jgi:hypothetical protein